MQHFVPVASILEPVNADRPLRTKLILAALAVAAALSLAACYKPPPRDIQDLDYNTAESMVRAADRIDHVRLDQVVVEQVEMFNQANGESLGEFPVTYLVFNTIESFKGSADPGDPINVALDVTGLWEFRPADQTIEWNVGDEYVVFLKGRARPSNYPASYGGALWTPNGEPWVARINGDHALDFAVSDQYLRVVGSSDVSFSLDLDGLRFLAGS